MKRHKVCVYAICKNEAAFVDKWMDSMEEADEIIVTDTGSEDDTVEKLQNRGATVYVDIVKPWRFDVARNISLDHVPEDADICVCTDLDEIFTPGWREHLEKAWSENEAKVPATVSRTGRYLYNWSLKPDGTPDVQFHYFKVHQRQDFRWAYPIHECIKYQGTLPLETIFIEGMVLNHYPDPSKSRGSYLELLEMAVKENPMDDRMTYYLGREYMYAGQWENCINTLKRHITMPTSTWNEEKCASMRWIARSYKAMGKMAEAYSWFYRAIAEAPHLRDPYVEFAKTAYERRDWPTAFFIAEEALKIKNKSTTYVNMGYSWDYTPNDLAAIACYHLKMYTRALDHATQALTYSPNDPRLLNNIIFIEDALKKTDAVS